MKYQIVQIKEGRYRIDFREPRSQRSQRKATTATQRAGGRKETAQAEEAVRQGKEAAELPNQIAEISWELEAVEGLCNELVGWMWTHGLLKFLAFNSSESTIISTFYHFEVMDIVPFVLFFFKVQWLDFILAASSLPHEDEVWKLRHLRQVEMVTLLAARSALCLKSSLWLKIRYISATRPSAKHGKLFRCSWVNQSPLTDWSLSWALWQVWCSRKLVHKSSNRALCHVHIRHGPQKRTWGRVSQDGISWE